MSFALSAYCLIFSELIGRVGFFCYSISILGLLQQVLLLFFELHFHIPPSFQVLLPAYLSLSSIVLFKLSLLYEQRHPPANKNLRHFRPRYKTSNLIIGTLRIFVNFTEMRTSSRHTAHYRSRCSMQAILAQLHIHLPGHIPDK